MTLFGSVIAGEDVAGRAVGANRGAPGDAAGKAALALVAGKAAQARPHAVGGDQHAACRFDDLAVAIDRGGDAVAMQREVADRCTRDDADLGLARARAQ